jgi:hypothetical protein
MDGGSKCTRAQLLHLDVCVDEQKPRGGVLELLGRLRPQWKPQDIKMKVSEGIKLSHQYANGKNWLK